MHYAYIYLHLYQDFATLKKQELEQSVLSDIIGQSIIIPCAYCKQESLVPIRFDQNNELACDKCNKTSAIYVEVESAQITVPLGTEQTIKINEKL